MNQLTRHLSHLETSGLIRLARIAPELEYLFRHALVQDAAYSSLLAVDRQRLHLAVGQAVEQLFADRLDELAATLARHFQEAGERHQALAYFVRAADSALATYANQEAESHYRCALALAGDPSQRAALLTGLGEAIYRQGRFEDTLILWREAIDLHRAAGNADGAASLYSRAARGAWYANNTPLGLELCLQGLDAVAGAPDSRAIARLVHETARAYHFNGMSSKTKDLCLQALEMAERLGAVDVQADTLTTLAVLPDEPGELALVRLRRAVELAEGAGLLEIAHRAYHNLGYMTNLTLGDLATAREHFRQAAELARRRGALFEQVTPLMAFIGNSLGMGDIAEAERELPELEALVESLPNPEVSRPDLDAIRASLLFLKGQEVEAGEIWRVLQVTARERGNLQGLFNVNSELAWSWLARTRFQEVDDWQEVEDALAEAIPIADRGLGDAVGARCALSIVRSRQGRLDEARRLLAEAHEHAAQRANVWHSSLLLLAQVELEVAQQRWSPALATSEELLAQPMIRVRNASRAQATMFQAEILARRGEADDLQRALVLLRQARVTYLEMGSPRLAARAGERLEELRSEIYARALAHGHAARELAVAGRIQAGLLPESLPSLPGWQLAVVLEPARETWGDFYDVIPLPGGLVAIVVADVSDKGAGAALYMALSRTIIRTYAAQFPRQPAAVLAAANDRLMDETHTGMFVTVFYGVVDPVTGELVYSNAGHNPPLLMCAAAPGVCASLERTGMALGVTAAAAWDDGHAHLAAGDSLLIYTDGLLDAQGASGEAFGPARLLEAAGAAFGRPADELQHELLARVHAFVGGAPRYDDLTLVVLRRE